MLKLRSFSGNARHPAGCISAPLTFHREARGTLLSYALKVSEWVVYFEKVICLVFIEVAWT